MEPSSKNVSFSHGDTEKALSHPFLDFGDTETNVSLDMKPSSKKATALAPGYGDGGSPVPALEAVHTETLDTNVSGDVKGFLEVEESSEKASPGSSFGEMQVESSVLVSAEVVNKEAQHYSLQTHEVGEIKRKKEAGAAEKDGHGQISLHNTGKQNESEEEEMCRFTSQKVEQNQAKQEVEPFSAQSPVTVEQNQSKREIESFSAQSTMTEAEKKKQVSNSTTQNGLLGKSSKPLGGSKEGATMDVSVKMPWSKFDSDSKLTSEPEFTMEATTWPTLAEARDRKPSFKPDVPKLGPKPASSKVEDFIPPLAGRKPPPFQKPSVEIPRQGANFNSALAGYKYKSSDKRGNMMQMSNFPASENLPSPPIPNPVSFPNQSRKGNAQMGMKGSMAASPWVSSNFHNEAWRSPNPVNTANWHNSVHASGRGHPGWHHADPRYGYGQVPDNRFNCIPPQEFHVAPMYAQPFYNINPAFYNIPNFQMWHTPAGFNNNAMNIVPPGPPKGMRNRFEHVSTEFSIESSIRKQVEYYFSNENLHKDKYLKSLMDNEGYVPVSLLARFNRMRELTSSQLVILEALKNSSVVEVKGEKIRRTGDWKSFLSSFSTSSETSRIDTSAGQKKSCDPPSVSVLLNNDPRNTVSEQDSSSSSSLDRGESNDSYLPFASVLSSKDPTLRSNIVSEQGSSSNSSLLRGDGNDVHLPSASVLLNNDPTEQDISSSSSLHRGDSDDAHLTAEATKEMNLLCLTNSSLVNEENCSSLDDPVNPSLSQGETNDSVEMNESGFVDVSHSQLISYIAVP